MLSHCKPLLLLLCFFVLHCFLYDGASAQRDWKTQRSLSENDLGRFQREQRCAPVVSASTSKQDQLYKTAKSEWQSIQRHNEQNFDYETHKRQNDHWRVLTWNVAELSYDPKRREGDERDLLLKKMDALIKALKWADADIVTLQEFPDLTKREWISSGGAKEARSQWDAFLERAGYSEKRSTYYQFSVFSKKQVVLIKNARNDVDMNSVREVNIRSKQILMRRAHVVQVRIRNTEQYINFAATHGLFGSEAENHASRVSQFKKIAEQVHKMPPKNHFDGTILAGDLNEDSAAMTQLWRHEFGVSEGSLLPSIGLRNGNGKPECGMQTYWRGTPVDKVLASGGLNKMRTRTFTVPSTLSDHIPVIADFDMTEMGPDFVAVQMTGKDPKSFDSVADGALSRLPSPSRPRKRKLSATDITAGVAGSIAIAAGAVALHNAALNCTIVSNPLLCRKQQAQPKIIQ